MGDRGGRERRKERKRGKERGSAMEGTKKRVVFPKLVTSSILYTTDPK